jgi:hypothetical protein
MSLRELSDQELLAATENLVRSERAILTQVLHHLREINCRRMFSDLGFRSLFEYSVKKLGYPEDQAYRRINAMRLLDAIPEIESKINDGSVTLTTLSLAQSHFRNQEKTEKRSLTANEKVETLKLLENKSSREAEKVLSERSGSKGDLHQDKFRVVGAQHVELKFVISTEVQEKLNRLKNLLAHSQPNLAMADLLELLCDLALEKPEKSKQGRLTVQKVVPEEVHPKMEPKFNVVPSPRAGDVLNNKPGLNAEPFTLPRNRYISAPLRQEVWFRDKGCCTQCGSTRALQVDHIEPFSLGGTHSIDNLRLLCRSCNQRAAIKKIGLSHMTQYLN